MPPRSRLDPRTMTRADLPAEFTPQTVRRLGYQVLRRLSDPDNGILSAEEQASFDEAASSVLAEIRQRVADAESRAHGRDPRGLDPEMRRSYQRTQRRLAEHARRTRDAFPEVDFGPAPVASDPSPAPEEDHVTADSLSEELEESSTTLALLDRIASIQQQQLEHQESQLLLDTRGYFFALLVSVSVIVAGVAPLVEAEPHDRLLIVVWTLVAVAVAGIVYAGVRLAQRK